MGKLLKTPEIVPFRLTRDMVDAMGITGLEGIFRKTAEQTMKILRKNQDRLLTVLEVFVHDPLYKWALSPNKIQQLRPATAVEDETSIAPTSTAAVIGIGTELQPAPSARQSTGATLHAVQQAFDMVDQVNQAGMMVTTSGSGSSTDHDNTGAQRAMLSVRSRLNGTEHASQLSVEGQVAALIHEATDMERLAAMYFGKFDRSSQRLSVMLFVVILNVCYGLFWCL